MDHFLLFEVGQALKQLVNIYFCKVMIYLVSDDGLLQIARKYLCDYMHVLPCPLSTRVVVKNIQNIWMVQGKQYLTLSVIKIVFSSMIVPLNKLIYRLGYIELIFDLGHT